jgi:hypothetical protein
MVTAGCNRLTISTRLARSSGLHDSTAAAAADDGPRQLAVKNYDSLSTPAICEAW